MELFKGRLSSATLVAVMLSCSACLRSGDATRGPPSPPDVSVAAVVERRVTDWDEFTGRFDAVENVGIRPRVTGYIDRVVFTEGALVKRGELLFLIDPRPYQAEYDRSAAEVERNKTALELAQIELDRVQRLRDSGAVSQEELDERRSTFAQTKANLVAARASLEAAAINLGFTRVVSPIDGRVGRAEVTRGNLVTGGNEGGTLLTTLVSVDPIYLFFDADEQSYLRYTDMARAGSRPSSREVHNPVKIGLANETGFPHAGAMNFVDNQVNPATGTIRARAVVSNAEGLYTPGLFARVQLLGSGEYPAILIDDRAVSTDQSQKYVFLLGAGNTAPVPKRSTSEGLFVASAPSREDRSQSSSGMIKRRPKSFASIEYAPGPNRARLKSIMSANSECDPLVTASWLM